MSPKAESKPIDSADQVVLPRILGSVAKDAPLKSTHTPTGAPLSVCTLEEAAAKAKEAKAAQAALDAEKEESEKKRKEEAEVEIQRLKALANGETRSVPLLSGEHGQEELRPLSFTSQEHLHQRIAVLEKENKDLQQIQKELLETRLDVELSGYFSGLVGTLPPLALKILSFWFGSEYDGESVAAEQYHLWFGKSAVTDLEISFLFKEYLDPCADGQFDHWCSHPLGLLALVILMDQFPRNIYRNSARSFAYDWKACTMTWDAIKVANDDRLSVMERVWLYLVFTHSEDLQTQKKCMELAHTKLEGMEPNFKNMWQMIFHKHLVVIESYGRFPHRNKFMGRPSTLAEEQFVNDPSYRFDLPVKLSVDEKTGAAKFEFQTTSSSSHEPQRQQSKDSFGSDDDEEPDEESMVQARQTISYSQAKRGSVRARASIMTLHPQKPVAPAEPSPKDAALSPNTRKRSFKPFEPERSS